MSQVGRTLFDVYGYNVVALRVHRKEASSGPLQIDNLDGRGLDLAGQWEGFFSVSRNDHVMQARRYWQTETGRRCARPAAADPWFSLDVEYGPHGIPGRVFDTHAGRVTATFRSQDATVHRYRHVLAQAKGGSAALLAAEVIGQGRAFRGPVEAFREELERGHPDLRLEFEYLADGTYWEEFLEKASLVSATLTQQGSVPAYTNGSSSGQALAATLQTTIKATGRGRRLPHEIVRVLLNRVATPREVFGVGFDPDRTSLLLEADGQRRQVWLEGDEPPNLVYAIGAAHRRTQPSDVEFLTAAGATLERLLTGFPT